jgi:hypothetical protein
MRVSVRRLLVSIAVVGVDGVSIAEAIGPCPTEAGLACAPQAVQSERGPGVVRLVADLPVPGPNARRSLLGFIPAPPPRTLGAKLWALLQRGVRIDGTVSPTVDARPPLPGVGKKRFDLAMVGVKVRFGESIATELWGELVGIEVLDHSVSVDGTFRPF